MTSGKIVSAAISPRKVSRRGFLAAGLTAAAACLLPCKPVSAALNVVSPEKSLFFHNTHTGENLKTIYWHQGTYITEALSDINHILRDHRTEEVREIDVELLDLLFALQRKLGSNAPFNIISGYRSPETNALLNSMSNGVVKNSLHIAGKAIDIRLPGYSLKVLRRAAIDLGRGGVGYYPSSDFVHVDVGRIRCW